LQGHLFDSAEIAFDDTWRHVRRTALDETCWLDHGPGWLSGSDELFRRLLATRSWAQRTRWMVDRRVLEPRLTAPWSASAGSPLEPDILERMRRALSARYGVEFDSVGFNLYRDGRDSVAWHRDRIARHVRDPVIAIVSLGEPRRFLLRPRAGGRSRAFDLGRGDLLVTGGRSNREWLHCVPKVRRAGPRISLAFRHGLDHRAYGEPIRP
jgi:alkylated DNA repair dioxygenase AlkB